MVQMAMLYAIINLPGYGPRYLKERRRSVAALHQCLVISFYASPKWLRHKEMKAPFELYSQLTATWAPLLASVATRFKGHLSTDV